MMFVLSPEQLEELRLLSNAEMDSASPFAGLLIGQPTLATRLRRSPVFLHSSLEWIVPAGVKNDKTELLRAAGRSQYAIQGDRLILGEAHQIRDIHRRDRYILRHLRRARIARQGVQSSHPGRTRQLPGNRVLPATISNEQNSHLRQA